MDIIKKWQSRLRLIEQDIDDYVNILNNNKLNSDMRMFCLSKIQSKNEYKELIEVTLQKLLEKNH